jgi:hypothetical protein
MGKTVIILVCLIAVAGCRKQSGGQNGPLPPGSVVSVRYHDEVNKALLTTEFDFQGSLLISIRQQNVDSDNGYSRNNLAVESLVYSFQYLGSNLQPVSYAVTDTSYWAGGSITFNQEEHFQLGYDSLDRIISDSLLDSSAASPSYPTVFYWYYGAGGIGEYVPGFYGPWDTINYVGDLVDWYSQSWSVYAFGATPNPLYDPALGNSIGPLMFHIGGGDVLPPVSLPIDFFSQHLPVSGQSLDGDFNFTWEKDRNGRVTGGLAVPNGNAEYGPTDITFSYR